MAIFIMLVGVNMFYFLVSNINSIISESIAEERLLNHKYNLLFKLMSKYQISGDLVKGAKNSIDNNSSDFKLKTFSREFNDTIRRELDYSYFWPVLGKFSSLKYLRQDIFSTIGMNLKKVNYFKGRLSMFSNQKITIFTLPGTR